MNDPARQLACYEDLLDLPEHLVGEIIHGVLHSHPRPALRHARAASSLGMELGPPFQRGRGGPGGWWILDEPELHLGAHVVVPDLAGWQRSRVPQLPDAAYIELPPDWICEVLSPATAKLDRTQKLPIYAQFGVQWAWLIDPRACRRRLCFSAAVCCSGAGIVGLVVIVGASGGHAALCPPYEDWKTDFCGAVGADGRTGRVSEMELRALCRNPVGLRWRSAPTYLMVATTFAERRNAAAPAGWPSGRQRVVWIG